MAQEITNSDRKTILIIGGSYAGLSCAHYLLQHVLPDLQTLKLHVTLVNSSSQFTARTASPRAAVSKTRMPPAKLFYDIAAGFNGYPEERFSFIQGQATSVDPSNRVASILTGPGGETTVSYYALIIATGSKPQTPLLGVCSTSLEVEQAHSAFQHALEDAKHVVIVGGGPAAVEMAGEVAQELVDLNAKHPLSAQKTNQVSMIVRSSRLLHGLPLSVADAADHQLQALGVTILYNTTIESTEPHPTATGTEGPKAAVNQVTQRTIVKLSDGNSLDADLFVPATGVTPNTDFMPKTLLNSRGYITVHQETLRVETAGARVYAIGDCADYKRRDLLDLYDAIPVVLSNLKRDMIKDSGAHSTEPDAVYRPNPKHTQLIPIGRGGGVGLINNWTAPSWLVWWIKGRDYLVGMLPAIVNGSKWKRTSLLSKAKYLLR